MSSKSTIVNPASAYASPSFAHPASSPSSDRIPAIVVSVVGLAVFLFLASNVELRQAVLFLIGIALGAALLHASFGFAGGWRNMLLESRSRAIRAQMIMVGIAAIGFFPLLALSPLGDRALIGAIAPAGVAVAIGAAMFGVGMQMAGGSGIGARLVFGPWSLLAAAIALAVLNIATLVIAGHPWSITYAFGLWGAKIAQVAGVPVAEWAFWQAPYNARALSGSVLEDVTSVMTTPCPLTNVSHYWKSLTFSWAGPVTWSTGG